jgi:hypothetical protein
MKSSNNSPLEVAEYFSFGISIIGSIVASGLGQIMYATTPIFLTLFLNILNRNRLHQEMHQNTISEVNRLDKLQLDHSNLVLNDLYRLENSIKQIQDNNSIVIAEVGQRIQKIPHIDRQVEALTSQLNQLSENHYLLQEQIQRNIKIALNEVGTRIEKIPEISRNINSLNRQINDLNSQINEQSNTKIISQINQKIESIKFEIEIIKIDDLRNQPKPSIETINTQVDQRIGLIESKVSDLVKLDNLSSRINNRNDIDISTLTKRLEPLILLAIQKIINQPVINSDVAISIEEKFNYELIYNRSENQEENDRYVIREKLRDALRGAKKRIIMVCPWVSYGFNHNVDHDIEKALCKGVQISIGWGHLLDIEKLGNLTTQPSKMLQNKDYYEAVPKLIDLQKRYDNLHLKLIGTHEKFLICDDSWALITSHNFLSSGSNKNEREIGLWTNDKNIISELIQRYESAIDLDKEK